MFDDLKTLRHKPTVSIVLKTFFALSFFTRPPIFLPVHNGFYPSKWRVDGSLHKAMLRWHCLLISQTNGNFLYSAKSFHWLLKTFYTSLLHSMLPLKVSLQVRLFSKQMCALWDMSTKYAISISLEVFSCTVINMQRWLVHNYPPLSIARYSFIHLSELEQCELNKFAQC